MRRVCRSSISVFILSVSALLSAQEHGAPETVRYHFLPPLLLDQMQKQERKIEAQQKTIDALLERLEKLERQSVRNQ